MSKHIRACRHDDWYFQNDSLGPDPYEAIQGFKRLPHYECRLCGDFFSSDNLKEASRFDHSIGEYDDPKPICFDCAKRVDLWDWRIY